MSGKESGDGYKVQTKMDLDKLLKEEIGECGIFQIRTIVQCIIGVVFYALMINEYVFTAGRIDTRCVISECENPAQTEFNPSWITNAVPLSGSFLDNCQRFGNISFPEESNTTTCPATLFNSSVLQQCDGYVYENTDTIVYDFGLGCQEWLRSMVGSVRLLGMMVALPLTGFVSDRWGRRRALALSAFFTAVVGVTRYWAPNYLVYVLLMALESVLGAGSYTSSFVLTIELLGPKYRVIGGAVINSAFATGQVLLGLLAWAVTGWRNLILTMYIPQFLSIFYFWTITESVRWLMRRGKFKESEEWLKRAARVNKKTVSQKSLNELIANAEEVLKADKESQNPSLILLVLRDKRLIIRCLVTCMWYVTVTFVYYGLSINALNLSGNKYLNYVMVAAVEIPGYWTAVLLVGSLGRKPTLISAFWLCTACQVAFIFISSDRVVLSLIFYFLGKWAISGVVTVISIYTLELYPTESRQRFIAFSSMIGRLGAITAPLTPALGTTFFAELPFILFGGMAFLTGLITFLVPETRGCKLADTMDEALTLQYVENKTKSTKM